MRRVRLSSLVLTFVRTALMSVGGGGHAHLYDNVVARRGWITSEEFVQDLTLAQILPGPTFANLAVALGFRLGGWSGAAWALLSILLPGTIVVLGLAALYVGGGLTPSSGRLLHGMSAAVIGFVVFVTARLARTAIRGGRGIAVALATFLAVGPFRLNTALVIVVMAAVSGWLHRPGRPGAGIPAGVRRS